MNFKTDCPDCSHPIARHRALGCRTRVAYSLHGVQKKSGAGVPLTRRCGCDVSRYDLRKWASITPTATRPGGIALFFGSEMQRNFLEEAIPWNFAKAKIGMRVRFLFANEQDIREGVITEMWRSPENAVLSYIEVRCEDGQTMRLYGEDNSFVQCMTFSAMQP